MWEKEKLNHVFFVLQEVASNEFGYGKKNKTIIPFRRPELYFNNGKEEPKSGKNLAMLNEYMKLYWFTMINCTIKLRWKTCLN